MNGRYQLCNYRHVIEECHDVIVGYVGYVIKRCMWNANGACQWYYCGHMDEESHDVIVRCMGYMGDMERWGAGVEYHFQEI